MNEITGDPTRGSESKDQVHQLPPLPGHVAETTSAHQGDGLLASTVPSRARTAGRVTGEICRSAWFELRAVIVATGTQIARLVTYAHALWRRGHLTRDLAKAQFSLGERMYRAGVGDEGLRQKIAAVEERIRSLEEAHRSTRLLKSEQMGFMIRLAAAMQDAQPPLEVALEYDIAATATRQLCDHDIRRDDMRRSLFPALCREQLRVIGGVAVLALIVVFLICSPFAVERPPLASKTNTAGHYSAPTRREAAVGHRAVTSENHRLVDPESSAPVRKSGTNSSSTSDKHTGTQATADSASVTASSSGRSIVEADDLQRELKSSGYENSYALGPYGIRFAEPQTIEAFVLYGNRQRLREKKSRAPNAISKVLYVLPEQQVYTFDNNDTQFIACYCGIRLDAMPRDRKERAYSGKIRNVGIDRHDSSQNTWFLTKQSTLRQCQDSPEAEFIKNNGGVLYVADGKVSQVIIEANVEEAKLKEYTVDLFIEDLRYDSSYTWGAYRLQALRQVNYDCDIVMSGFNNGFNGPESEPFFFPYKLAEPVSFVSATVVALTLNEKGKEIGRYQRVSDRRVFKIRKK